MLIGVDCGSLVIGSGESKGGVFEVSKNLLESLGRLDKKNNYILYSFHPIEKKLMNSFGKRMRNIVVSPTKGWMLFWLPIRLSKDKPDVFLGLSQAVPQKIPFLYSPPVITIMYDIAFEKLPKMYLGFPRRLKINSRKAARKSDLVITTSNVSKKDIEKIYGILPKKIKTVYPCVSKIFSPRGKKYKSKNPYFLYVGALKPTKNIPGLIRAFEYFLEKTNSEYKLLIAGSGELGKEASRLLKKENNKKIEFLGFVSDSRLSQLYKGAVAFVSPSFYEGFGMTFLEAIRSGCPIIGSNTGSISEVVPNSAILVSPYDYKKTGEAMIKIAGSKTFRQKMIEDGLKKSQKFTSERFGKSFIEIINNFHE